MIERMKWLINKLNEANHAYYNLNKPIMTDREYDKLYDELLELEQKTGIVLSNSPTQNVGCEVVSKLNKVEHEIPLLSLNKTKNIYILKQFIGDRECVLSLKCDGLTTKLEYKNGELFRASTRGNGKVGEDITHNVRTYRNVPLRINDDLVVVGESIITYDDFEKINETLEEKYSNPRNLASGSVRQLDSKICAERNVRFLAFGLQNSTFSKKSDDLNYLQSLGFEVVPYYIVNKDNVEECIDKLKQIAEEKGIPIDGLVCTYNDNDYANSLGATSKHPKHSLAFKFDDEVYETRFIGVEANTTRTGMISLTGIFEPVDIDGVMVSRASLHNVDFFEWLKLGKGDIIKVRRSGMVIPQILDNLTKSNTIKLPDKCPVCGSKAVIKTQKEARFLYCPNDDCEAKLIKKIVHFVSRDAMNIVGLSEATIEKFVEMGFINSVVDLYSLEQHKNKIVKLNGFGVKSFNKLIQSIENSKTVNFANFIYALGIKNVGLTTAKTLAKHFDKDSLPKVTQRDLLKIGDIGEVVANSVVQWFANEKNMQLYRDLINIGFSFKIQEVKDSPIAGKVFVITGSVEKFKNRKELQKLIEELGGKVSSSVSKTTDYLINNDVNSSSSKNVAAKKLGVPIISEDQFLDMIKNN